VFLTADFEVLVYFVRSAGAYIMIDCCLAVYVDAVKILKSLHLLQLFSDSREIFNVLFPFPPF